MGQYQHDNAVKFTQQLKHKLKGMFNLLDSQNGMEKLADAAPNNINKIKSTDAFDASKILAK